MQWAGIFVYCSVKTVKMHLNLNVSIHNYIISIIRIFFQRNVINLNHDHRIFILYGFLLPVQLFLNAIF